MTAKYRIFIGVLLLLAGAAVFFLLQSAQDPCIGLAPCDQYRCRYPDFYCKSRLFESHTPPRSRKDAEEIVHTYVRTVLGTTVVITSSLKWRDPYKWYQVNSRFPDGSEHGYEVGPDGTIYEIARLK